MVSKCANPACSTPFRYLREGKLFQLYSESASRATGQEGTQHPRHLEYFWLCGHCAATIKLEFERKDGEVVVRMRHTNEAPEPAGSPAGKEVLPHREVSLHRDDRDLLELLKFELKFLEDGGYGRSVHDPHTPTRIFQDSIACINFGDPARSRPCEECLLMGFVPEKCQHEDVPCHFIPLTEKGETVADLEGRDNQMKLEEALAGWLRAAIQRLEKERAGNIAERKAV